MPTYDYRCERTGEMFEYWQSFSDDAITSCPQTHTDKDEECGAPVKKVFSKVGISFKGEGFYKNDHGANAAASKSESRSNGSDQGSSSSSESDSTSSSKSDSTSSSKSEASSSSSSPSSSSSSKPSASSD